MMNKSSRLGESINPPDQLQDLERAAAYIHAICGGEFPEKQCIELGREIVQAMHDTRELVYLPRATITTMLENKIQTEHAPRPRF